MAASVTFRLKASPLQELSGLIQWAYSPRLRAEMHRPGREEQKPVRLTHIEAAEPLAIDYRPVAALIPYARNARTPTGAKDAECPSA